MAKHLTKGNAGEQLAEAYLRNAGFRILARNWRHRNLEIDLIALDGEQLVFIEVKTRNEATFGPPTDAVDWKKEQRLARAASAFIHQSGHRGEIRFDIVSVILPENLPTGKQLRPEIELVRDAFWPR